jgi:hypothetical protein
MLRRRIVPVILALPFLWLAGRWIAGALASDESRIRSVVRSMFDGFNETDLSLVMDGLAPEYVDASSGLERRDVRDVLIASFFQDVDSQTHEYLFRAELVEDELRIQLAGDGSAEVALAARFHTRARGEEQLFWEARIEGRMVDGDDGWQWTRTTRINHEARKRPR